MSLAVEPYFPITAWMPSRYWQGGAHGTECAPLERHDPPVRPRDTNAGTIAVTTSAGGAAAFDYEDEGHRYVGGEIGQIDDADRATVEIRGNGSEAVPAFQATVFALGDLVITSPREQNVVDVATGDFVVRWTTSDPTPIGVVLSGPTGVIACTFEAHRGYGVVPRALMKGAFGSAPEVPCIGCASLMIVRELVTHAAAGDYDLEMRRIERRLTRLVTEP